MKITFLGTADGVPRPGRRLSSAMIEANGGFYFIDMGCQVMNFVVEHSIPAEAIKAVFITHMHGDHTAGLFEFTDLFNWYFKGDPVVYLPKEGASRIMEEWNTALNHESRTTFGLVREGAFYDDGSLRVSAVPTTHIKDAFAYVVEAEGKRVFFSGDFNIRDVDAFREALSDGAAPDLLVFEAAHPDPILLRPMIEALGVRRVYFNHVAPYRADSIAALIKELPDVTITVSADGTEIEV